MTNAASIEEVVRSGLCSGCGACSFASRGRLRMVDVTTEGLRPSPVGEALTPAEDQAALAVCPGVGQERPEPSPDVEPSLLEDWGAVLGVFEGHACDEELRYRGSSGGAASALALFCIERGGMHGVLHVGADPAQPWRNQTTLSSTREELLERTGSRYSPASPCDGLDRMVTAPTPCVFIGKPCDVAGCRKAAAESPELAARVGLTIAFFCAGTPSTAGTLEMLTAMGITDPTQLSALRYRGHGWPGRARAETGAGAGAELSYAESWDTILQRHRPWRCYVCADHGGELADISVADPWYRQPSPGEPGSSLILPRTELGRRILSEAREAGYVELEKLPAHRLVDSQRGLLRARARVFGQLLPRALCGRPRPRYERMNLFATWRRQGWRSQLRSLAGGLKRLWSP